MGLEKLLHKLNLYLDKKHRKAVSIRCDRVDSLLKELEKKEKKLRKKLAREKNKQRRKQLGMDIRIVALERKKGMKRRRELRDKCK